MRIPMHSPKAYLENQWKVQEVNSNVQSGDILTMICMEELEEEVDDLTDEMFKSFCEASLTTSSKDLGWESKQYLFEIP
jgi:hypothetical protein